MSSVFIFVTPTESLNYLCRKEIWSYEVNVFLRIRAKKRKQQEVPVYVRLRDEREEFSDQIHNLRKYIRQCYDKDVKKYIKTNAVNLLD